MIGSKRESSASHVKFEARLSSPAAVAATRLAVRAAGYIELEKEKEKSLCATGYDIFSRLR